MKYELLSSDTISIGQTVLYRVRYLKELNGNPEGTLGGYIQSEANLSQYDNSCVYDNARVYGNACVYDNARVYGNARVYDNACVYDNARVYGKARVYDNACVYGKASVYGNAHVASNACVFDNARVYGNARVYDNACVYDNARVYGKARVYGNAELRSNAQIERNSNFLCLGPSKSSGRFTTAFKTKCGFKIATGCFLGSLEDFRTEILRTHSNNPAFLKQYLAFADCIEASFSNLEQQDET